MITSLDLSSTIDEKRRLHESLERPQTFSGRRSLDLLVAAPALAIGPRGAEAATGPRRVYFRFKGPSPKFREEMIDFVRENLPTKHKGAVSFTIGTNGRGREKSRSTTAAFDVALHGRSEDRRHSGEYLKERAGTEPVVAETRTARKVRS